MLHKIFPFKYKIKKAHEITENRNQHLFIFSFIYSVLHHLERIQ